MDTRLPEFEYIKSIHHSGGPRYVRPGAPRLGNTVTIRLRNSHAAPIHQVLLRTCPDGEQLYTPMLIEDRSQWDGCT